MDTLDGQIRWDLGAFHPKGTIEFEIKGPLRQRAKHVLFSAWNESAGSDGDRKTQGFFHLRAMELGMMLRLTYRPGGKSFEGLTGPLAWPEPQAWVQIKGQWDTTGGDNILWWQGQEVQRGRYNRSFEGFRWIFLGRDNYKPDNLGVAGANYRNMRLTAYRQ
jgi:hypothetical protein